MNQQFFGAKLHEFSTVVLSGCSSSFACSHPGMFLMNSRLIWIERAFWVGHMISARRAVSWSNRVRSRAASAICASIGATAGVPGSGKAFINFVRNVTRKFSAVSVFESNFMYSILRICSSCNWGLQNRPPRAVIENSKIWRVARGRVRKNRKAASRWCNFQNLACWLAGSSATRKILRRSSNSQKFSVFSQNKDWMQVEVEPKVLM